MPAVHLDQVSFRYSSAVDVISSASLHLGVGWTGVVGCNGSGKTTLLRQIAGELLPTTGTIILDPADAVVVLCEQEVDAPADDVSVLAGSWEGSAGALRSRLQLEPGDLDRWQTLSAGERKRWQIAAALSRDPDVLLLDEPTNHLDVPGRKALVAALEAFQGIGLLVSHDRSLLDRLTTRTLRVERASVDLRAGTYTVAAEEWAADRATELGRIETLRREHRKAERRLADQRQAMETKRARFRRRQRTSTIKDIDARSAARGGKHNEGEKAAFNQLATTAAARKRIQAAVEEVDVDRELGRDLFIDYQPAPKKVLVSYRGPLVAGEHLVAPMVDVTLKRGQRIWLRGRNGSGKTTLVEKMLDTSGMPEHRILWLPQELSSQEVNEIHTTVMSLSPYHKGRLMAIVAALGVEPSGLLATDRPSPGEARKLTMALGLQKGSWLVALDEPTNHLDLPSIQRLEGTLRRFPGTMIVVSHDEAFAEALNLEEWVIEDGALSR